MPEQTKSHVSPEEYLPVARRAEGLSKWGLDESDLSLLHWMLELTPTERLQFAQGFAQSAAQLRNARRI